MRKLKKSKGWQLAGSFGVDAGLCWIGDPCYILHKEQPPKAIGKDWNKFCSIIHKGNQEITIKSFNYDLGHEGLGVCIETGLGDGFYPVYVQIAEVSQWGKRICQVIIDFMDEIKLVD